MQSFKVSQFVFYACFLTAIYLIAFPFKGSTEYLRILILVISGWVFLSGAWNILVATKIIVANKRMQRKINNMKNRAVVMGMAAMWMCVAGYIFYRTFMKLPILPGQ